ncbi:hypothetical protein [Microbacterium sp.]|uniref:hypothetical protein n=1 Tax=Microbacterium sp. TaxID=51671 RepID=UPI0039E6C0A3
MATIRNLAITIHRLNGATSITKATRHAMHNPEHARHLTRLRESHAHAPGSELKCNAPDLMAAVRGGEAGARHA